jgi:hypothetical protein
MRWYDRGNKGTIVIGGNGKEEETNQFNDPEIYSLIPKEMLMNRNICPSL